MQNNNINLNNKEYVNTFEYLPCYNVNEIFLNFIFNDEFKLRARLKTQYKKLHANLAVKPTVNEKRFQTVNNAKSMYNNL